MCPVYSILEVKILTTRSSIEGERKLVTVSFAYIVNDAAMVTTQVDRLKVEGF